MEILGFGIKCFQMSCIVVVQSLFAVLLKLKNTKVSS